MKWNEMCLCVVFVNEWMKYFVKINHFVGAVVDVVGGEKQTNDSICVNVFIRER